MLSMDKWKPYFAAMVAGAVLTSAMYEPAKILIFKIREPYFGYPIKSDSGRLAIRNDGRGDGDFGTKRRNGRFHAGIDILAPVGTPVYASKSGIAFRADVPTGYGKYVMIYHPDGTQTIYGHLSDWKIASAEMVRRGEVIGLSGKTGNASYRDMEPHLHFEIRKKGTPLDPQGRMR